MSWGIFQKIGQGLKKAFNFVKDDIVKPVAKVLAPIAKPIAAVAKTVIPGAGPVIDLVSDALSSNHQPPPSNMVGMNGHGIRQISDRIQLK